MSIAESRFGAGPPAPFFLLVRRLLPMVRSLSESGFALAMCFFVASFGHSQEKPVASEFVFSQRGELPILITAPHGGQATIVGVPERRQRQLQIVTARDESTDTLAQKIAGEVERELGAKPYLVIAKFHRKYADANRPTELAYDSPKAKPHYDAYHAAIASACQQMQKRWGRGILLDIHGQGVDPIGVFRGTQNHRTVTFLVERFGLLALEGPKSILGQLEAISYRVIPAANTGLDEDKRFNGGYTVQTYGSHTGSGIDAIQLEFGANLRSESRQDQTARDVGVAVAGFGRTYLLLAAPKNAKP